MKQLFQWTALSLLALTTAGCGLIKSAVQANEASRLEKLEAAGDYEGLAETCDTNHHAACKAKTRVGAKRLEKSSCETLIADTKKYYRNSAGTQEGDVKLVDKFFTCKLGQELFTNSFSIRWRKHAWIELDKAGKPVFDTLVSYLADSDKAFEGEGGTGDARSVAEWLIAAAKPSRCAAVNAHIDRVAPESRGEFLWFYYEQGCTEQALPMAREWLSADRYNQRIQACDVLSKFGAPDDLDKLQILVDTDPHKQEREVRTASGVVAVEVFYPVRERCLEASGKIRLRH